MSDPTQPPPEGDDRRPPESPSESQSEPPYEPPSAPPPGGQGAYGTGSAPPPPPGGWQQPGQMPPPSYQGMTGGPGQPADLWPRFAARLIDYILLTVVNVLLGGVLVAGMLMNADTSGSLGSVGVNSGTNWAVNAVTSLISAVIALGYFSLMENKRGQTIGKMLLNLETRGPDGGRPTLEQAVKRNAFTAIGVLGIIPFLGFIAGLLSLAAVIMIAVTISQNTTTRHGWHDDFAGGTTVVRLR
ncbi:MAG TPA: RDD family protein [Nocardioidaceae bacterium]|nr:RDD family protein [Nocardioidaceae bacterium]